jgi:hypothetical protein
MNLFLGNLGSRSLWSGFLASFKSYTFINYLLIQSLKIAVARFDNPVFSANFNLQKINLKRVNSKRTN